MTKDILVITCDAGSFHGIQERITMDEGQLRRKIGKGRNGLNQDRKKR